MGQLLSFVCSPENDVLFLLLHHQSNLHLHTALYVHWSDIIRESAHIYEGLSPSLKNEKLRCTYRILTEFKVFMYWKDPPRANRDAEPRSGEALRFVQAGLSST